MIKTVRLDKKENYLIDTAGNIIDRYSPDIDENAVLVIKLEDSMLKVDASKIKTEYGGQLVVQYNDDKFIIDDGYQDSLIKSGYIVYQNFDIEKEYDKDRGYWLRSVILDAVKNTLIDILNESNFDFKSDESNILQPEFVVDTDDYSYKIIIDTVDGIVNKNNKRKYNSLSFYPFDKNMDKYGTVYVSIFAQKKCKVKDAGKKYKVSSNIISNLNQYLGSDYHFVSQPVKRRVLYWNGL